MKARLRLRISPVLRLVRGAPPIPAATPGRPDLAFGLAPARTRAWALLISLGLHLGILLFAAGTSRFSEWQPPASKSTRALEVHIPLQLLRDYSGPRLTRWAKAPSQQSGPTQIENSRGPGPYLRGEFRLPDQWKGKSRQTVLQPEMPEDLKVPRMPNLAFWSVGISTPKLPSVTPGRPAAEVRVPRTDSPANEASNDERSIAPLKMDPGKDQARPSLVLPAGNTVPIQSARAAANAEGIFSIERYTGQAANLLALNPSPAPLTQIVLVPPASQMGVPPQPGPGLAGGGFPAGPEKASSTPPSTGGGAGATRMAGRSHDGDSGTGVPGKGVEDRSLPKRMTHPDHGAFDLVISRTEERLAGLLTGEPVYTVYLEVGASVEWALHYCIPEHSDVRLADSGVLQLGDAVILKAPYPKFTVLPPQAALPRAVTAVSGFLTPGGRFRGLRLAESGAPRSAATVLPYLEQWVFRPASRGDKAVEVSVVLVIPAETP